MLLNITLNKLPKLNAFLFRCMPRVHISRSMVYTLITLYLTSCGDDPDTFRTFVTFFNNTPNRLTVQFREETDYTSHIFGSNGPAMRFANYTGHDIIDANSSQAYNFDVYACDAQVKFYYPGGVESTQLFDFDACQQSKITVSWADGMDPENRRYIRLQNGADCHKQFPDLDWVECTKIDGNETMQDLDVQFQ